MIASGEPGLSGALPIRFPIFPLPGAILLPGGNLPLNIFEPRYLQMTRDAMRTDRVIGMIQPTEGRCQGAPAIYPIGCVGRITSFAETDDGRYLITLTGVCRFEVVEELAVEHALSPGPARASSAGSAISSRRRPRTACARRWSARCAAISRSTRSAPTGARSRPRRSPGWSPRSR